MAHVVVLGAGIGGLPCAYELNRQLGPAHEVTLINEREQFQFIPSNPWVAVGWRDRQGIAFDIRPHVEIKNVNFIAKRVDLIDPKQQRLTFANGTWLSYDYLVIATGPKLAFDEVPGTGPQGYTHSICTLEHAEQALAAYEKFLENPGRVVIGTLPDASCFGPAYEFAFILDADLRKRRMRDRVPMTLITPEPYIGHMGLAGVGDSKGFLESELRMRHINWITNARTTRVESGKIHFETHDEYGRQSKAQVLDFDFAMLIPAFRGVDAVAGVEGLCNDRGFVIVDEYQRSPVYKNIYAAGVCIAIPPVEETLVPTNAPKTGYMIETMVTAIVHNIEADIKGGEVEAAATWNAVCLADMGDTGAAFVALPQMPPRNLAIIKKGKWVHMAKIAFEKYFIRKMKSGASEPIYEKYILKMLGINKLK